MTGPGPSWIYLQAQTGTVTTTLVSGAAGAPGPETGNVMMTTVMEPAPRLWRPRLAPQHLIVRMFQVKMTTEIYNSS